MQYPQWSESYGRWHTKDYRSWREHHIKAMPPKLIGTQLGMMGEEDVDKLRTFFIKASPKVQGLIKKEGQRTSSEMDIITDVAMIGFALAHLNHWRKEGGLASEERGDQAPAPEAKANGQVVPVNAEAGLVLYEEMRIAIQRCKDFDEAAEIRDQAERYSAYARIAGDKESARLFKEIRARAKRKMGQLSQKLPKAPGSRTDQPADQQQMTKEQILSNAGVSTSTAHDYENLAGPADKHEETDAAADQYFETQRANNEPISEEGLRDAVDKAIGKSRPPKQEKGLGRTIDNWIALGADFRCGVLKAPGDFAMLLAHDAFIENWSAITWQFKAFVVPLMDAIDEYNEIGKEAWAAKYDVTIAPRGTFI